MVHFNHSAYPGWGGAVRYYYRGLADFEDGVIEDKSSKSPLPSKGIYPTKNTEKSRLFYGVRGVRRTAALFKNRVDNRYPRVLLTHTMIGANQGIDYLATVDNYDKVEWYRTLDGGDTWHLIAGLRGDISEFQTTTSYGNVITDYVAALRPIHSIVGSYVGNTYESDIGVQDYNCGCYSKVFVADERHPRLSIFQYGNLPCNINTAGTAAEWASHLAGIKCRVYKGNVWAESDIIYANGTIEKNPNPKLTPPVISVQFVPYQGIRAVKELKPPTINLSLETDTAFTRTEEIAPLSLSLALESPQITRAVLELRPPLISLEVEAVEGITRTEGHRTKPEITVNYSTVADVQLSSIAIMSEPPLIIGVDGGKTETVTVLNYAPTPELSVSITREDAVGTVAVPIYPEPLIIGVDGGKTETVTVSQVTA